VPSVHSVRYVRTPLWRHPEAGQQLVQLAADDMEAVDPPQARRETSASHRLRLQRGDLAGAEHLRHDGEPEQALREERRRRRRQQLVGVNQVWT
jgi:murein endopeptidase